jgi:hypothetical protein
MSFKISCPHCKRMLKVTEPAFGKTVPCPGCNHPINIPIPSAESPSAPPTNDDTPWSGNLENPRPGVASPPQPSPATPPIPDDHAVDDPLAFLRPEVASASTANNWPPVANGSVNQGGAPPPGQLPPNMPGFPALDLPNSPSLQSAFPKGAPLGVFEFFDFGFKRYLTPWIVRLVWVWGVCLLALGLLIQVAVYVHKSMPSKEVVRLSIPPDARMKKLLLDDLIQRKERSEVTRSPRRESAPPAVPSAPGVVPRREPEPDWYDQYAKMTLRQLRTERQSLEDKFPETGTKWTVWSVYYLAAAGAAVLGTILTLVFLRVVCELIIVVFNIAMSLTTIANNTSALGTSHERDATRK